MPPVRVECARRPWALPKSACPTGPAFPAATPAHTRRATGPPGREPSRRTMSNTAHMTDGYANTTATRRITTETKSSFKTTELIAYVVAVIGVLVAAAITDT